MSTAREGLDDVRLNREPVVHDGAGESSDIVQRPIRTRAGDSASSALRRYDQP